MLQDRILAGRGYLDRYGVDAILFLNLSNIRYLAGFTGSDGAFVLGRDDGFFLTDSRYTSQAGTEVTGFPTVQYRGKQEGITGTLEKMGVRRIGFEAEHTTVAFFNSLAEAMPDRELVPIGIELDELRQRKDGEEIAILEKTAGIASAALIDILHKVRPGTAERDVALALEFAMKSAGADEKAFDFIVASGTRGALPHGRASDKQIRSGELVTIDFGARFDGYHSDETVTVAVDRADARQREIYGIVKDAHDKAVEAVKPGVALKELDGIARGYIDAKGYGQYFGHGLGHGVGLDIHEKPTVSFRSDGIVEEGMVITIEPGIYIPDWGGVRIEDTVVVTADGCRILTKVPKELTIV